MGLELEAPPLSVCVDIFKALSDPVRVDLLERIASVEEMSCTELVDEARVSASTVSYHVKLLKAVGLVAVRKEGRNFHYTFKPEAFNRLMNCLSRLTSTGLGLDATLEGSRQQQ